MDTAPLLGLLVENHVAADDVDAAGTVADRLAELASEQPGDHLAPHAALAAGRVLRARRDHERAARRFEQAVDAQYRAALAPVATEGVAAGVAWVPRMRTAAQKRLAQTAVSDAEGAEEFLACAPRSPTSSPASAWTAKP